MRAKKVTSAAVVVTNAPTTVPPPPKYDLPRFDPTKSPTKKPIYKKASDYMTKFSTKRRNSRFTQLCLLITVFLPAATAYAGHGQTENFCRCGFWTSS